MLNFYTCLVINWTIRLTTATLNQTISPKNIGLNPVFYIFLKSESKPIADKAITIINFPRELILEARLPLNISKVFNREAAKNPRTNQGKPFLKE